ncbi:hypothetical protein [Mesobacillus foraminis]|uniref:Immunity protein 63 of polymorphic toxin system n=1 Tax=Mesobacillus foraminis TaxID=279826 RepID=A0A4V2RDY0_9BACI|nr:hypothetical protein [Mesobacillus foraminis]TCN26560.1 hypothetical protein EV146_10381 [Mesobacillus foraminis]
MLYIWDIEKIIKNALHELKIDLDYAHDDKLAAPMSYNVSIKTIKFNYLEINGYIGKIKFKETQENLVKIILYHVIGYYLDFKKNKHDTRILMYGEDEEKEQLKSIIETNAWEYGRKVVPENLLDSYDKVREFDKQLIKSL